MKIVHVVAPAAFGGLESVVATLATAQSERGHTVSVVALLETGTAEPSLFAALRSTTVRILPVVTAARASVRQRRALRSLCRELVPDVVHSHGYLPDVLSASQGKKFRAVRVSTVHGFTGGGPKNRFYEWLQRRAYSRFDAVVAVSRPLADTLRRSARGNTRIEKLPNAWQTPGALLSPADARRELDLSAENFNIAWVGRISREKGADVLIESLRLLEDLPVRITVIGDGPEKSAVASLAKRLGVEDRISWRGAIESPSRLLRAFDAFVNSSRTEGTPITLLEAMNATVPIVATAVGGVPDMLSNDDAYLVPKEQPAAIAAALRDVHGNRGEAARRAARARERLECDFSVHAWVDAYDGIYSAVIATRT